MPEPSPYRNVPDLVWTALVKPVWLLDDAGRSTPAFRFAPGVAAQGTVLHQSLTEACVATRAPVADPVVRRRQALIQRLLFFAGVIPIAVVMLAPSLFGHTLPTRTRGLIVFPYVFLMLFLSIRIGVRIAPWNFAQTIVDRLLAAGFCPSCGGTLGQAGGPLTQCEGCACRWHAARVGTDPARTAPTSGITGPIPTLNWSVVDAAGSDRPIADIPKAAVEDPSLLPVLESFRDAERRAGRPTRVAMRLFLAGLLLVAVAIGSFPTGGTISDAGMVAFLIGVLSAASSAVVYLFALAARSPRRMRPRMLAIVLDHRRCPACTGRLAQPAQGRRPCLDCTAVWPCAPDPA